MLIWRYVIFTVAMATTCRAVSSLEHGPAGNSKQRRFIFNTQVTVRMCTMFCPLVCVNGFVKSTQGCFLCQCLSSTASTDSQSVSQAQTSQHLYTAVNGGVFLDKPCNPAVRHCRLQCTSGFLKGTNGCQHCACSTELPSLAPTAVSNTETKTTTTTATTTHVSASQLPTTVVRILVTTNRPTVKPVVTRPVTKQTTITPTVHTGTFNDPCIPSQKTCNKQCNGHYVKGPGGCQYCLCATNWQTDSTTTLAPGPGKLNRNTTIPHYLDLSPTSEACIMAKVICNQKCEHGFISHPNDCLFCSCLKPTYDTANDDPGEFYVTLPNPCVENTAMCGIKCLNGYVMGPRDCEFCSCRF